MCECEDVSVKTYGFRHPRARKPHRCHECGTTIPPDTTYWYFWAVTEEGFGAAKVCEECEVIRAWLEETLGKRNAPETRVCLGRLEECLLEEAPAYLERSDVRELVARGIPKGHPWVVELDDALGVPEAGEERIVICDHPNQGYLFPL